MYSNRAFAIMADLKWSRLQAEPVKLADQVVAAAQAALPVTGVSLAWMSNDANRALLAATDELAGRIDELHIISGEGPSTRSAATGRPVLVEDLACGGSAWPAFTAGALEAGVAATFAFPLRVGENTVGVLDLYRNTPGPLTAADMTEVLAWATVGTWVLLHLTPGVIDESLFPDLTERLAVRSQVQRAAGALAYQQAVTVDDALTILRARAFTNNKPIADLARDVLTQTGTAHDDKH